MNEAKASATFNCVSPKGFSVLYTVRDDSTDELFKKVEATEHLLVENGYTPRGVPVKETVKAEGAKPVETKSKECPVCGEPLVEATIKGQTALRCSTNSWDPIAKKASGCKYFRYLEEPKATTKQKEVLESNGLWEEGMSKREASAKISELLGK